eukprot:TRINITY_DN24330_c0_g1_i1.p1 TRINITY_DN24330_c0_g1~~TRINITY_DN24330_c0_g1_i1.p1  ORF type:complete len:909 (+),score=148.87 TRINITY_DN24330_c0_g1_i1:111-2837(+)
MGTDDAWAAKQFSGGFTDQTQDKSGCGLCGNRLVGGEWFYFQSPCGHGFHFVCARRWFYKPNANIFTGPDAVSLECNVCSDYVFKKKAHEDSGIAFLMSECSEGVHRYSPERLEFFSSSEVKYGRPMQVLRSFPSALLRLRGLRCIDIQGFPIKELPEAISVLADSLYRFVLISLQLQRLPDCVGDFKCLEQFIVTGNPLRAMPEGVGTIPRLGEYYFDGNKIETLPSLVPPRLRALKLSGNHLRELPDAFESCQELEVVRVYANQLSALPPSMCFCSKVMELSLQGNNLAFLPEEIGRLQQLRHISVHDNQLETLPESLLRVFRLRRLIAYNNKLRYLPQGLLEQLDGLEILLVEANPLDGETMADLIHTKSACLRTFGVDEDQMTEYLNHTSNGHENDRSLPKYLNSGQMLPWDRLYAKLTPASLLRSAEGMRAAQLSSSVERKQPEMLVVAFSASQGEPEWLGALGKVFERQLTLDEAARHIQRENVESFREMYEEQHDHSPKFDVPDSEFAPYSRRACETAWFGRPPRAFASPRPSKERASASDSGARVKDFDVLALCDTNAQWYYDTESAHRKLFVRKRLEEIAAKYKKVVLVGASMGGFAALSHSDLADLVAVFGPQTDLTISHLRPGFEIGELEAASEAMRQAVAKAVEKGTRIEYHVAAEEHLYYAQQMKLPRGAMIVHPLEGRVARSLESAGLLTPLMTELLLDVQLKDASGRPSRPGATEILKWDWKSPEEDMLMAIWGVDKTMSFCTAAAKHLSLICNSAPAPGEWLCSCRRMNGKKREQCSECKALATDAVGWVLEPPWPVWDAPGFDRSKGFCSKRPPYQPGQPDQAGLKRSGLTLQMLYTWLLQAAPSLGYFSAGAAVASPQGRRRGVAALIALLCFLLSRRAGRASPLRLHNH